MKLLVQGNNVDKAADMAITILSVVDNNDQLKRDETVRSMMPRFEGQKQNKTKQQQCLPLLLGAACVEISQGVTFPDTGLTGAVFLVESVKCLVFLLGIPPTSRGHCRLCV